METAKIIMEIEDSFKTALQIEKSINTAKAHVMKELFEEFEREMESLASRKDDFNLKRKATYKLPWNDYKEQATEEFYDKYSTYPGISYVVKTFKSQGKNFQLLFRIEIENALFAGFCLLEKNPEKIANKTYSSVLYTEDLKAAVNELIVSPSFKKNSWWVYWRYLPTNLSTRKTGDGVPNFKPMNPEAAALVNEKNRKNFVKDSIAAIEEMLKKLK